MLDTLLSTARRRHLGVYGILLAASSLAACDKTDPLSPKPVTPSKASGVQIPQSVISFNMIDQKNNIVKYEGAMFEIFGPFGLDKIIYDDGPEDSDQSPGQVKLYGMANGQYKICQVMVAQGFTFPPGPGASCFSGYLNPGGELTHTFFNPWPPYIQWNATTDVGTLVGGGSKFTVKDSVGAGWTITDDDPLSDSNPWEGGLQTSVSHPGTWTICETAPPAGYVKPAGQPCVNIVVDWGSIGFGGSFANNLPYSANWGVTEGVLDLNNNYVPLAGATFTVAYQRGLSKTTVTDNGPGDYDPRPGRLAMKLGAAGSYTVCEVTAPANHWLPKPPCQTTYVTYATPAFVGWFITPQAQVYKP